MREHQQAHPTLTAATAVIARQEGVSRESARRLLAQAGLAMEPGPAPRVMSLPRESG